MVEDRRRCALPIHHTTRVEVSTKYENNTKLPFSKIEDVSSITQGNATIVELVPGLFLTPTQLKLMEDLG